MSTNSQFPTELVEELRKKYEYMHHWNQRCEQYLSDEYEQYEKEIVSILSQNINQTISYLNQIDFNDEIYIELVHYFYCICRELKTFDEKYQMISCVSELQQKFPNVKMSPAIFWMCIQSRITSESIVKQKMGMK